jgi:hypothetical protein
VEWKARFRLHRAAHKACHLPEPGRWFVRLLQPRVFQLISKFSLGQVGSKPGIDSSLSNVPPLKPKPRPDIFPTAKPQAATKGPITMVVLSPTPPVECLSTAIGTTSERSSISPEWAIARVKISCLLITHSIEHNRHGPGGCLVIWDLLLIETLHKKFNFFTSSIPIDRVSW